MSARHRKLIGAFLLFALVIVWALLAMAIAQVPVIFGNPWLATLYYVAGRDRLGAAGDAADQMDVEGIGQPTLTGRNPFHIAVAAPDTSTRA